MKVPLLAEVPDPQAVDWYWSLPVRNWAAQQEVSGGQVNERGFICTYSRSPSLSHHPQMGPSSCRKTSSGLPLILHYGELYNYFIIYHNVIIIELKCTLNVMHLNYPETIPLQCLWRKYFPQNQSVMPKRLGTSDLKVF